MVIDRVSVPGWEGSCGPFKGQYAQPHVYARDVMSGSGNCVCGTDPRDKPHVPSPLAPPITERAMQWLIDKGIEVTSVQVVS